ncbi:hypothetical protein H310_01149 [Aphanomyces invadans]|uniref:MRH domain-containing protein n=1 Tax=Aphanomyces invadans TaxID=157072 RepID=A0A024UR04_9STRA|nr:hypothetical protein H310_01149 [Aphanomyces invadans]ETW08605.1 hypothetical protein H310_01149 [Aphanomyces invadans]|eukprot:XP_008862410.1 hypothetical protein H310_01149 [Aphanomyces invadans]
MLSICRVGVLTAIVLEMAVSLPTMSISGATYVVRLHSSASDPLNLDGVVGENALLGDPVPMTSSNGKRYLCYVPVQKEVKDSSEPKAKQSLLEIARDAITRLKPRCLPTVETELHGSYEICHGKSVAVSDIDGVMARHDTKRKLGTLQSESFVPGFANYEFRHAERYPDDIKVVERLATGEPVYTQVYGHTADEVAVVVQYVCASSPVTALLGRRPHTPTAMEAQDRAIAFLFGSRWFCFDKDAKSINDVQVAPFVKPSFEAMPCIRRTEGWWSYEFCLDDRVSQFHREQNGETTAEFSLGVHAPDTSPALLKNHNHLTTEFLDDTYDKPQPTVVQVYEGGTPCGEVERTRSTRVLLFCPNLNKQAPYIISIQESATCSYLLKVAVPSLCEHPHFANEERLRLESLSQTIHCVPSLEITPPSDAQAKAVSSSTASKTSKDEL